LGAKRKKEGEKRHKQNSPKPAKFSYALERGALVFNNSNIN
jgi:hypothetical protein